MPVMTAQQYGDLPQINMDEPRYAIWSAEHYNYVPQYGHINAEFNQENDMFFENFDSGMVSMQPMERFLHDPYPITHGVLHAKFPSGRQSIRQYEQWPSANCLRNVSPDGTSASGNSSYATQNELRSPKTFPVGAYGSPTDAFSQSSLPYPTTEHFNDCGYSTSPPHSGSGNISLRELEYEPREPEPETAMEDLDAVDVKHEVAHDHEHDSVKMDTNTSEAYKEEYPDSGIGNSVRDAESVQPIDLQDVPEDTASDSDYNPTSSRTKRRRSSTSKGSSHSSSKGSPFSLSRRTGTTVSKVFSTKVTKRSRRASNVTKRCIEADDDRRPFPCPLANYGCSSTFSSKNEWKRHVSTQHIKLGYWRCDLCPPTTDPNDDRTCYYNDFNRKDLFTQHLRRMHAAPKDSHPRSPNEFPVNEDNLAGHQTRCLQSLRTPPQLSVCLFCDKTFQGPSSWEERMEHVGRHLEKDRKGDVDVLDRKTWNEDKGLEQYLVEEGLIIMEQVGWKIGDGKPRRSVVEDSDEESVEE